MPDFQLTMPTPNVGYKPPVLGGDLKLTLSPEIQAAIAQMTAGKGAPPALQRVWTMPNWSQLVTPVPIAPPPGAPAPPPAAAPSPFANLGIGSGPLFPQGAGPATPRIATLGDVGSALWGIPLVKQTAERQLKKVADAFQSQPGAVKGGEIGVGVAFVLAGYMMPGKAPWTYIQGQAISIPGMDGLSFTFDYTNKGAGVSWESLLGSPLSVEASGALGPNPNGSVTIKLDVTKLSSAFR